MAWFRRSKKAQQRASTKEDQQAIVDMSMSGFIAGFCKLPNELRDEVLFYIFGLFPHPGARSGVQLWNLATSTLRIFDIFPSEIQSYVREYLMSMWMTDSTYIAIDRPEDTSKYRHSMAHYALIAVPIDCRSMVHDLELRCTGRVVQRTEVDATDLEMPETQISVSMHDDVEGLRRAS
ncbi:uncharacterized protein BDZ99DRAFT_538865 [Mytilinidion resinicola]|uniref:Uncharacterized protein n=1 Tax=Mytilinidion resinicola TaxID=574789 RepID=A0A6A6YD75_9PEZI|nr:uncharacterized protein BDZ99DRAFT_538865 [Mytilinidion resinicola]KAF2806549.1 hypothetical protein BDZ99DRAFT_538865 [Mytilinidion resinicola]